MPIVRTWMCPECAHCLTETLELAQWQQGPPPCPRCADRAMQQEFKPAAIRNTARAQAEKMTEDILRNDYHVSNLQQDHRLESTPTRVQYQTPASDRSTWSAAQEALEGAIALGRKSRQQFGSGLDVLQSNLRSGIEPDLIENSKRRSPVVW